MGLRREEYSDGRDSGRINVVIQLLDTITDLLGVLNHTKINLNISYNDLMTCSLYELSYWIKRGNELADIVKEQYEELEQ